MALWDAQSSRHDKDANSAAISEVLLLDLKRKQHTKKKQNSYSGETEVCYCRSIFIPAGLTEAFPFKFYLQILNIILHPEFPGYKYNSLIGHSKSIAPSAVPRQSCRKGKCSDWKTRAGLFWTWIICKG